MAMLVSFLCGQFLSVNKGDFRPTTLRQYLGMLCDFDTTILRVPQDKLDKLQQLLRAALNVGVLDCSSVRCSVSRATA